MVTVFHCNKLFSTQIIVFISLIVPIDNHGHANLVPTDNLILFLLVFLMSWTVSTNQSTRVLSVLDSLHQSEVDNPLITNNIEK